MKLFLAYLKFAAHLMTFDREAYAILAWRWHRGDSTLRVNYPLSSQSIVLDIGGYTGDWTYEISRRYGAKVYVYEPVPLSIAALRKRFYDSTNIVVADYGLSSVNGIREVVSIADASGAHRHGETRISCRFRDVNEVLTELAYPTVDLVKINIEGDEYDLLNRMLDTGWIGRCRELQIQFHSFIPDARNRREKIRSRLAKTHQLTYDYYFVWENWKLVDQAQCRE